MKVFKYSKKIAIALAIYAAIKFFPLQQNYKKGFETKVEKNYNVDLIGRFSNREVKDIEYVFRKAKEKGFEFDVSIKKENNLYITKMQEEIKKGNSFYFKDGKIPIIAADVEIKEGRDEIRIDPKKIGREYKKTIAHELGHIILEENEKGYLIEEKFLMLNGMEEDEQDEEIPYNTFISENIATTFESFLLDKKTEDESTKEKINALEEIFSDKN